MGYYVKITNSNAAIPAANKLEVLQIWKKLNKSENDYLKRGGSYQGGKKVKSWFSWMDADYDKTCNTVESILDMLGFEYEVMADGEIVITDYDNKRGQEDLFFNSVKHLMTGTIEWQGEEGEEFTWTFTYKVPQLA